MRDIRQAVLDKLLHNLAVDPEPFALCMIDDGWRLRLPAPPVVVFHFVLKGQGVVCSPNGSTSQIAPQSAIVVPAGTPHALQAGAEVQHELNIDAPPDDPGICRIVAGTREDHDLVLACGRINARFGESVGLFDHLRDVLTVDMSGVPRVEVLMEDILEEQSKESPGSKVLISSLMMQLLVHMFRQLEGDQEQLLPWLPALADTRLTRALDEVFDNPGAQHTVNTLADCACMSRSAFAEHFSAAFSRSPMNFVNHVRMEHAARLLHGKSSSVDQIANEVGFSSRSHFSQAFKKHTGHSPAEYRRQ